jgi:hypothetical protein
MKMVQKMPSTTRAFMLPQQIQGGTVGFESGSQGLRANGIDASSTYVEHAVEYLGIEVTGTEVRNCATCAEKRDEVYRVQEDKWQDAGLKESKSSIEKENPWLS